MKKSAVLLSLSVLIIGCYHIDGIFIPDNELILLEALPAGIYRVVDLENGKPTAEQRDELLTVTLKPDKSYEFHSEKDEDTTIIRFAKINGIIVCEVRQSKEAEAYIGHLSLEKGSVVLALINTEVFDRYLENNKDKPFVKSRETMSGGKDYFLTGTSVAERWKRVKEVFAVPGIMTEDGAVQLNRVPAPEEKQ